MKKQISKAKGFFALMLAVAVLLTAFGAVPAAAEGEADDEQFVPSGDRIIVFCMLLIGIAFAKVCLDGILPLAYKTRVWLKDKEGMDIRPMFLDICFYGIHKQREVHVRKNSPPTRHR